MKPGEIGKRFRLRLELEALEDRTVLSLNLTGVPTWTPQGPSHEIHAGSLVGPNNPVSGAIESIAVNPHNPAQIIVGTVNGGVWRTTNADANNPAAVVWTPLTDNLGSLAIGAVAFDPSDASGNTFYAGTGLWTNSFAAGGPAIGLYKTVDGGAHWTYEGQNALSDHRVKALIVSGTTILVGTINGNGIDYGPDAGESSRDYSQLGGMLFISTNGGATFTVDSGTTANPLPAGAVPSLVQDPNDAQRIFAAIAGVGVFRSEDGGVSWRPFSTGLAGAAGSSDIELTAQSIGGVTTLFAGLSSGDVLGGVYAATNFSGGGNWAALAPPPGTFSAGAETADKFQLAADPTQAGVVYIDGQGGTGIFRYNPSGAGTWVQIDRSGTLSGTSPHIDSRDLKFLGTSTLLEADDGGIFLLKNPTNAAASDWQSLNGNLNTLELYAAAHDGINSDYFAAAQDNGSPNQNSPGSGTWTDLTGGDGQQVQVDTTSQAGDSLRYELANNWSFFYRFHFDMAGDMLDVSQGYVSGATNAGPIVITAINHGLQTGDRVRITGALGNADANGLFTITVLDANDFALNGAVGNGTYIGGGAWQRVGAIATVAGAAGSPVVITSFNHRLSTGDQVYVQGLTGNAGLNNSSYYITVLDASHFALDGATADGSSTTGGSWMLSSGVLLKSAIGAPNLSGLSSADLNNLPSLFKQPFALNAVNPTHMMLGFAGLYEDAGLSTAAGGLAGDVIANITNTVPGLNADPAALQGVVSAIAYGGWIGSTPYADIALVGTNAGQLFFRDHNQTIFANLSNSIAGEGDILSIAIDPQDYRRVYVLNGDQLWFTPDVTHLTSNPFEIIGGGTNDNLGRLTAQLKSVAVVGSGASAVPVVGGLGGVFRLLTPPTGADAQSTWSKYGQGLPGTVVQDVHYDPATDTLVAAAFGRGTWTVASASNSISQSGVLGVSSGTAGNAHLVIEVDPINPRLIFVSDGGGDSASFDPLYLSEVNFVETGGGDTVFIGSDGTAASAGSVDFVTMLVEVQGGEQGGDSVVVEDASAPHGCHVIITANSVSIDGDTLFGAGGILAYSNLSALTLELSNAPGNVVDVESTAIGTVTSVIGGKGGRNSFTVSSNPANPNLGNTSEILGQLKLDGGSGSRNRLLISNSASGSFSTVLVTSNVIIGLAPAEIDYASAGGFTDPSGATDGIILQGPGNNASNFLIAGTPAGSTTEVLGGTGDDSFTVSSDANAALGTTDFIQGRLLIDAGPGSNQLIISNLGGKGKPGVIITSNSVSGLAPAEIDYLATGGSFNDAAGADGILIRGSATGATGFNIRSTLAGSTTEVDGGAGDDAFNVCSTAPQLTGDLRGIQGALLIDGMGGNNSLNVSEAGNPHNDIVTFTAQQISSVVVPFTISYQATGGTFLNGVRLILGTGNNAINVLSALPNNLTSLFPGPGIDTVNVYVDRFSAYILFVSAGAGNNMLSVTDTADVAVMHNHQFGPRLGTVEAAYVKGMPSFIDYEGIGTVVCNPTADESLIQAMFHLYLDREGSPQEIAGWLPFLKANGQAALAAAIYTSWEARTMLVSSWYVQFLGRAPAFGEEQGWVNRLLDGQSEEVVLSLFLSTPEFVAKAGNRSDLVVQALFHDLLGRAASPSEQAAWVRNLNNFGLTTTAYLILASQECRTDWVFDLYNQDLNRAIVVPLILPHRPYFLRSASLDAGMKGWINSALDMCNLTIGICSTAEFYDDAD
jgi:hypothetical protein